LPLAVSQDAKVCENGWGNVGRMFSRDPENLPFIIGYHLEEILGVDGRRKSRLDIKHYSNEICF